MIFSSVAVLSSDVPLQLNLLTSNLLLKAHYQQGAQVISEKEEPTASTHAQL